ncbi:transcriptional regulator [Bordetella sp. H567]|uniref:MurR/RpiR family transcriptional regulator n=1 Tax=Bordetella sp. H567 TaxID=1697043 RepID=UPI00081C5301|nr:MurR/RpiR family transcriptional regulator [Bordetella sp. H567]AOB30636.1 transcriptional regulator [Bordetella sp. H567]
MNQPAATIAERIANAQPAFSRTQHRLAEYVLAHQFRAATMTIDEFAAANQVSVATANRFARALGLPGYPQFRAELARGFESALAPVEKLRTRLAHPASAAEVFAATLQEDIRNAQRTLQSLDAPACERAVDAILGARRVYIVGFGASGFLAGMLHRALFMHCDVVESLAGPGGVSQAARRIPRMTGQDLVVAIAFPRYLNDTVTLAKAARAAGVPVLALTDKPTSPLAPAASVALYAHTERQLSPNSEAAALSVIEALGAAVAFRAKDSVAAALGATQSIMPWLIHGAGERKR